MAGNMQWCGWCRAPMPSQPYARCSICGYVAPPAPFVYSGNVGGPVVWPMQQQPPPPPQHRVGQKDGAFWPPINVCQQLLGSCLMPTDDSERGIPPGAVGRSFPVVYGNKRALLVGITYWRSRGMRVVEGAVNDVNCMRFLLQQQFGFPPQSILVLTDQEEDPSRMPTRDNILAAMRWLVHGPGSSLVFYFSGHGSQQRDQNGDELDGYDEILLPMDFNRSGPIVDDEVHDILVRPLPRGVRLHAVVDACHSGSALDLPYVCNMNRNGTFQWEKYSRVTKGTSGGMAICFSSCKDSQKSSETSALSGRAMTGAMTYCFIEAVKSGFGTTYDQILQNMQRAIREVKVGWFRPRLSQITQLSSSQMFDIEREPFRL